MKKLDYIISCRFYIFNIKTIYELQHKIFIESKLMVQILIPSSTVYFLSFYIL